MQRALVVSGLLTALSLFAVSHTEAADAQVGRELAQENCARCHAIEKGGAFKLRPPSFQSIAIYRTPEDIWARVLSPSPHSNMPDTQWTLTPDQIQDIVAYIVSLDVPVTLPTP